MTLVVQYKGEKFRVVLEQKERFLIHTALDWKASKCGVPIVNKGEYEKWVSKSEVKILGEVKNPGLYMVDL